MNQSTRQQGACEGKEQLTHGRAVPLPCLAAVLAEHRRDLPAHRPHADPARPGFQAGMDAKVLVPYCVEIDCIFSSHVRLSLFCFPGPRPLPSLNLGVKICD